MLKIENNKKFTYNKNLFICSALTKNPKTRKLLRSGKIKQRKNKVIPIGCFRRVRNGTMTKKDKCAVSKDLVAMIEEFEKTQPAEEIADTQPDTGSPEYKKEDYVIIPETPWHQIPGHRASSYYRECFVDPQENMSIDDFIAIDPPLEELQSAIDFIAIDPLLEELQSAIDYIETQRNNN